MKYARKIACKHITAKGEISNSLQPLCYCKERDLVLGMKAYVCQVCHSYKPQTSGIAISDVFEQSKKIAEQKIKEKKLEFKIEDIEKDDIIDLSIDEFEEVEDVTPKFEKRKAGKAALEDGEDFARVECPFCGEIFDDLPSHIQTCEFAPDDASIDDIMPSKPKKRKKKTPTKAKASKDKTVQKIKNGKEQKKKSCPYCGKEFIRLGRHLKACSKRPDNADEEKEAQFLSGKIDSI